MKKILIYILLSLPVILMFSCYTDTVDNFSSFSFQIPVKFYTEYLDRTCPRISEDFSNLYEYKEYTDNRDKIVKAELLQFNYWIDSLIYEDGTPFDPKKDDLEFEYVKYSLQFAKPIKPWNEQSTDSTDFMKDPDYPSYVIGEFKNVQIRDYYRTAQYIIQVPDEVAKVISETLKDKPYYYIVTEYSGVKGTDGNYYEKKFKLIKARFDVVIRFEVKL